MLTFEQMKELVELVARHHLSGLEVERSGFRLKIDGFQAAAAPAAQASVSAQDTTAPRGASPPAATLAPGMGSMAGLAAGLGSDPGGASALPTSPLATAAPPPGLPVHAGDLAAPPPGAAGATGGSGSHILSSPIVGTFYRAPSPDAPSFVDVGSRVRKGQVLCIIEAMKLMNEIECDVDGVIAEIYPQNAQAVEFGEPLFAIRISG
ncbi:MAG TPA: acetyl-CoA carboxylase biotin carboxyl carrier protein [Thermoanaerobaculia bacterium]|nr:acetyl-CoA carboxylase biotin carboxyl carrier protein [Thermoanaerobaculia bacterium]